MKSDLNDLCGYIRGTPERNTDPSAAFHDLFVKARRRGNRLPHFTRSVRINAIEIYFPSLRHCAHIQRRTWALARKSPAQATRCDTTRPGTSKGRPAVRFTRIGWHDRRHVPEDLTPSSKAENSWKVVTKATGPMQNTTRSTRTSPSIVTTNLRPKNSESDLHPHEGRSEPQKVGSVHGIFHPNDRDRLVVNFRTHYRT